MSTHHTSRRTLHDEHRSSRHRHGRPGDRRSCERARPLRRGRHPRPGGHAGPHRARRDGQRRPSPPGSAPTRASSWPRSPTRPPAPTWSSTPPPVRPRSTCSGLAGAGQPRRQGAARHRQPAGLLRRLSRPPCPSRTPTPSASRSSAPSRRPRSSRRLNTLTASLMVDPKSLGESSTVFVSGEDAAAKATVVSLLESFGHDDVIDLGGLETARGTEMLLPSGCASWARSAPARSTSRSSADHERPDLMRGSTVLVTGGHRRDRAGHGHRSRRPRRPRRHRGPLGRTRGRPPPTPYDGRCRRRRWTVFEADLSAQAEVRRLAAEVKATYPRLDVLVNNVGGYWAHRHVTPDGLEHTFALNHLAPFLLTHELLGPAGSQRAGPRGDRVLRCPVDGPDRSRGPAGRARLLRPARLQPVQAGQRPVHLRAGPPARGHRRDRDRAAPRRGAHVLRS